MAGSSAVPEHVTPAWRMHVPHERSAADRNIHQPIPFGWYSLAYSDELQRGDVKPLRYFGRDLVLFRTESGGASPCVRR